MAASDQPGLDSPAEPSPSGRWFRSLSAGLVSLLSHLALLIALAVWSLPASQRGGDIFVVSELESRDEVIAESLETFVEPEPPEPASAAIEAPAVEVEAESIKLETMAPVADLAAAAITLEPPAALPAPAVLDTLPQGPTAEVRQVVGGSAQAVDRLTEELSLVLAQRRALLIWCFDQSGSMQPERAQIRRRVQAIYEELGVHATGRSAALLTSVTSFGKEFAVHTPRPTADRAEIERAIDAVPVDTSGVEMMCQAVGLAMQGHRRYVHDAAAPTEFGSPTVEQERQVIIILVTDESGDRADNQAYLEKIIGDARRTATRVYVIGREAVFGYPYAVEPWTDPESKIKLSVQIDRGPETAFAELLNFDGATRRGDIALLSGFGPWEQVRLARETGGLLFLLPGGAGGEGRKRLLEQMKNYPPDLDARMEYVRSRARSPLRRTIGDVVAVLDVSDDAALRKLAIPLTLPAEAERFAASIAAAIATARGHLSLYDRHLTTLERLTDERTEEPSRRWQANYDLLLAQLSAYRARTRQLLACLEPAAIQPPEVQNIHGEAKPTNYWRVTPVEALRDAAKTQPEVDRASAAFRQVVERHADTPWAERAAWELTRAYGWELREVHVPPSNRVLPPKPNL